MINTAIIGFCLYLILLAFTWLLIETDFLRVRLPCGRSNKRIETPKVLTVRELLDSLGDCPALPMPKSWDTFTPCAIVSDTDIQSGEIIEIGARE